jgi:hypothetical protein
MDKRLIDLVAAPTAIAASAVPIDEHSTMGARKTSGARKAPAKKRATSKSTA